MRPLSQFSHLGALLLLAGRLPAQDVPLIRTEERQRQQLEAKAIKLKAQANEGTFYSRQDPGRPPMPFPRNPYSQVTWLSNTTYMVEDVGYAYPQPPPPPPPKPKVELPQPFVNATISRNGGPPEPLQSNANTLRMQQARLQAMHAGRLLRLQRIEEAIQEQAVYDRRMAAIDQQLAALKAQPDFDQKGLDRIEELLTRYHFDADGKLFSNAEIKVNSVTNANLKLKNND